MHDAWDIIVEIPPTCNQLKFNTCKAKFSCMWTNPKTETWTYNHQAPPHLFLDFLKQITSKNLSFPTGPCKNLNSHFAFVSFSLKEGARKLPWVSLSSPSVHTPKRKTKPHPKVFPLSYFLGCIRQKVQPSFSSPFSLFLFSSLFALTRQPPLSHRKF